MNRPPQRGEGPPSLESALQHLGWVRQLAAVLVGGGADADDVAQEAWRKALENPPPLSVGWKAWLGGIVRHTARDRGRAESRRTQREIDAAAPGRVQEDPAALLERVEEERALVRLVTGMEEPYRTLLLRRFFDGWSITMIAQADGLPEATVRTRLRRGLERLRERAAQERGAGTERWLSGLALLRPDPTTVVTAASLSSSWTFVAIAFLMLKTLGLFAAVAALAFVALGPGSMDSPEAVEHDDPVSAAPAESLVAIASDSSRSQGSGVEDPRGGSEASAPPASKRPDPVERGLRVQGQVLTGELPLEMDGCSVVFGSFDLDVEATASAEIGPEGRFQLFVGEEIATDGERVRGRLVGDPTFGATQVELELRSEIVVRLPPTLLAHGRVSTTPAVPLGEAWVHFSDADGAWFLGFCQVEPDGTFSLPIRPHHWVSQIHFTVYSNGRKVLEEVVELAALTSARGLHYDFEISVVELVVKDLEGRPVPGAKLVLDSVPEQLFQQSEVELGTAGAMDLNLPLERFQYVVQAPGFEPRTGRFDVEPPGSEPQRVEVVLSRASEASARSSPVRLHGTVTLGGSKKLKDAYVSASAQAESWSVGHALYFDGVRTDGNGQYELMLPRPGVYMVTASHRDGPMSDTRPLSVMHELRFDVDLTPESQVFLRPMGAVHELPQTHGLVEWLRVQDAGESLSLTRTGWPHSLTVQPDRSYSVMGRLMGTDLFGETRIDSALIAQGRPVPVSFARATIASGKLLSSAGVPAVGARVIASPGAGAYRLAPKSWRSAVTDDAGDFQVFALGHFGGEETLELTVESGPWGPRTVFTMNLLGHGTLTLE
ncbi:RNA polymerase sigma factor [Saltatorellus ferox]